VKEGEAMFVLNEAACREIGRSAALRMWVYAEEDRPDVVAILYDLESTVRQFLEARNWTVDTGALTVSAALAAATDAGIQLLAVVEAKSGGEGDTLHVILDSGMTVEITASDEVLNVLPSRIGWRRASKKFRDEAKSRLAEDGEKLVGLADAESLAGGKDTVVCVSERGVYYFGVIKRGPEIEVPLMGEFAADRP
jgi:hypothetical protein